MWKEKEETEMPDVILTFCLFFQIGFYGEQK